MLNYVARAGIAHAELLKQQADELYETIVKMALVALAGVLGMWALNAFVLKELNWVPFFTGIAVFAIWVFAPTRLLIAAGAGAAVQGLKDEDLTQGAIKGLTTLYQVALGVMLWFGIVAGILAAIPFQARPAAFFPIAGMLLLLTLAFTSVKNRIVKAVIATFAVTVIGYNFWQIVPEDVKPKEKPPMAPGQASQAERSVRPSDGVIAHATWKGSHADGPPVGAESDVQEIPFGCGVNFSHGNGVTYKVRYCFRSCQSEKNWQDHQPGSFPPMSHLKFTVLEEGRGMTKVPFAWNCPGR